VSREKRIGFGSDKADGRIVDALLIFMVVLFDAALFGFGVGMIFGGAWASALGRLRENSKLERRN